MASTAQTVAKAHLTPIHPKAGTKAGAPIKFHFNPKEYTVQKQAQWESKPQPGSQKVAMPHYKGHSPKTTSIEILLDGYERDEDITETIAHLFDLCTPTTKTVDGKKPSPKWVLFGWGKGPGDPYLVKSVQVKYTLFTTEGKPARALCTVQLEEVPVTAHHKKQNPTSGATTYLRSHLVVAGDGLASIAYSEYGDAAKWRSLAAANGIDDPHYLLPGTRLLIPDIDAEIPA